MLASRGSSARWAPCSSELLQYGCRNKDRTNKNILPVCMGGCTHCGDTFKSSLCCTCDSIDIAENKSFSSGRKSGDATEYHLP